MIPESSENIILLFSPFWKRPTPPVKRHAPSPAPTLSRELQIHAFDAPDSTVVEPIMAFPTESPSPLLPALPRHHPDAPRERRHSRFLLDRHTLYKQPSRSPAHSCCQHKRPAKPESAPEQPAHGRPLHRSLPIETLPERQTGPLATTAPSRHHATRRRTNWVFPQSLSSTTPKQWSGGQPLFVSACRKAHQQ